MSVLQRTHPLARGCPPEWANSWGQDRHGVFAGFVVDGIEYRMRWIPPGTFMMGSPESEEGRGPDEGPQHPVTISRGLWLGEAQVTQAFWEAVMGENPSRFKGSPRCPVEQVSWEDCQHFCAALERLAPGLGVRLPSEAEWEYACRAGTSTATYAGDGEDVLDAIAWWSRNSGGAVIGLGNQGLSMWFERQTHDVMLKQPNTWGLHDMLGNVYEWCLDAWHVYRGTEKPLIDPVHLGSAGDDRVRRGGSWDSDARRVRAAFRGRGDPGSRYHGRGFRLARGLEPASPGSTP